MISLDQLKDAISLVGDEVEILTSEVHDPYARTTGA